MTVIIPLLIVILVIYALFRHVDPYAAFAEGAAEALPAILKVLPYLAAMLMAINVFRRSGAMELLIRAAAPVVKFIGLPSELVPLAVLRPFSGSAALAMLKETMVSFGADSFIGRSACVMVGSTETIFYTVSLYCGSIGITKTRHAIPVALFSGIVGTLTAIWLASIM